jgi:phosphoglycerate dehydrogenase-like enzyme
MKVLLYPPSDFSRRPMLAAVDAVTVDGLEIDLAEDVAACVTRVAGADLLITANLPTEDAARVLAAARAEGSRLRGIHFMSAGREGFDFAGLEDEHFEVSGPDGTMQPTVAEHALGLILAVKRGVDAMVRQGDRAVWEREFVQGVSSLEGETALVVGYGSLGQEIAKRLRPFGTHVIGLQRRPRPAEHADELGEIKNLDAYLPRADVVVLSLALTPETIGIMNAGRLAAMKPTAVLANVARGGHIDTHALEAALRAGAIGGAALDVTDPEPLPDGHSLWSAPHLIISPHLAGAGSPHSQRRMMRSATERIEAFARPDGAHS